MIKQTLLQPQVVAAFVAGVFAIIGKFLEWRLSRGQKKLPKRGFLGWLVMIAALSAIGLSVYSVTGSRDQIATGDWNEGDSSGWYVTGDTLVCYGYKDFGASRAPWLSIEIVFPKAKEFAYTPVITDALQASGNGRTFATYRVDKRSTKEFSIHVTTGQEENLDYATALRYNWTATGKLKK